jgi:hypothetical protein
MNERIKELSSQVGAVYNVLAMGRSDGVLFTEFELEKFAELIVEECMEVSLKYSHRDDDMGAIIAKQIKQHFGIEE